MSSAVRSQGALAGGPAGDPSSIVALIAEAEARKRRRFRVVFALTWIVLIGGLIVALVAADAIEPAFLLDGPPWWRFILEGSTLVVVISVTAMVVAIIFALLGALGRLSGHAVIQAIASLYVSLVRGTPLLVQILFIWLALPQIWVGFGTVDALVMGTFALAFNYGAYMTETFRAGIQAVPVGQREAAAALGMSERRILARILLPQAIRIVIPAIGNEFIAMMKDSSLLSVIGVQELLWRARTVGSQHFRTLETLLLAALVYWILTIVFSYFQERLERRLARADR
jgi:polar amino acid transport system permease protein